MYYFQTGCTCRVENLAFIFLRFRNQLWVDDRYSTQVQVPRFRRFWQMVHGAGGVSGVEFDLARAISRAPPSIGSDGASKPVSDKNIVRAFLAIELFLNEYLELVGERRSSCGRRVPLRLILIIRVVFSYFGIFKTFRPLLRKLGERGKGETYIESDQDTTRTM